MAELPIETINKIWDKGYQQGKTDKLQEIIEYVKSDELLRAGIDAL